MGENDNDNLKYGSRMVLTAIFEIILIALLKGFTGYATGMLILVAGAHRQR